MLSADGTSNLGNEVKPKPKQCLVDDGGDESDATTPTTPQRHPHLVVGLPPSAPTTPQIQCMAQELFLSPPPRVPAPVRAPLSTVAPMGDSIELLASLRQHSHAAEQALYAQLTTMPVGALNDVWHAFMIAAKGAVLNNKNSSASSFFLEKQLFTVLTQ
ncbi:hypothetical protein B0H14DRAFT_3855510 [Mycena olivaceomarginata]|nr:hypothetical protein B0H14DRAFT_3855510 [Mycena olivaceomarginata]